jgi:hypothetical protein
MRWWVVAVVLGVACEKPAEKCSPASCPSGCCDGASVCHLGNTDAHCGNLTCAACAASERCQNARCESYDAGATGGGGGATCSGCVLPTGACVPSNQVSVDHCGAGGGACESCFPGELCSSLSGVCLTTGHPLSVGEHCVSDAHCQRNMGPDARCKLTTTSGDAGYAGGYCTFLCATGACPVGSICSGPLADYGEAEPLCLDRCSPRDRCAPGYGCEPFDAGSACWVASLPEPTENHVGEPCIDDATCGGGFCLANAYVGTWPGGYCSKSDCLTDAECSSDGGAACLVFGSAFVGKLCLARCPDSRDGGQSTCRQGYVCAPLSDAGVDGFCVP